MNSKIREEVGDTEEKSTLAPSGLVPPTIHLARLAPTRNTDSSDRGQPQTFPEALTNWSTEAWGAAAPPPTSWLPARAQGPAVRALASSPRPGAGPSGGGALAAPPPGCAPGWASGACLSPSDVN